MDWFWFFLFLAAKEEERHPYKRRHSRYQKRFYRALSDEERQLRQRRIPRISLHPVHGCAWRKLFYSYNNQALITITGFDHGTFKYVLGLFTPLFDNYSPFGDIDVKLDKRGRK